MGVLFRLGWRPALTPCWLLRLHSSPGGGCKGSEQLTLQGRGCSCSSQAPLTNEGKCFLLNYVCCSLPSHPRHLSCSFSFFSRHSRPQSRGLFLSLSSLASDRKQRHFFIFPLLQQSPQAAGLRSRTGLAVGLAVLDT